MLKPLVLGFMLRKCHRNEAWILKMANSMFIPLLRMPSSIDEVSTFIQAAFMKFGFPAPKIFFDNKTSTSISLEDGFIMVEGHNLESQCWVSIIKCAAELTGDGEHSFLADVKTRGSWIFSGVVAYAFCKFSGRIIFNDAGELNGQESYTAESLKELIEKLISKH